MIPIHYVAKIPRLYVLLLLLNDLHCLLDGLFSLCSFGGSLEKGDRCSLRFL
jgi:hypothetical protein